MKFIDCILLLMVLWFIALDVGTMEINVSLFRFKLKTNLHSIELVKGKGHLSKMGGSIHKIPSNS